MGRQPVNTGSGASVSFLKKNHTFCHPTGGSDISTPDLDRTKISTLPTPPFPRPSLAIARHGRTNSTNRSGAQSPCRPRIGSWRPLYAGSLKESGDAAPSYKTAAASREIDVKAHQIIARRMLHMPRGIPDEDINTSATIIPSVEILGPITRSRAQ
jgi:hypothetical protein